MQFATKKELFHIMSVALVSNPIKISDGNWGEFIDLAGVMKELMNEVIEYLKSKGRKFLEDIKIHYGTNNSFNRKKQANNQEILYDLDYIQVDLFYNNAKKTYDSFYLKIYSTEVKNNQHEVLRFFRVADHIHQERKLGRVHIKRASNIIASIITEIKFTSSFS